MAFGFRNGLLRALPRDHSRILEKQIKVTDCPSGHVLYQPGERVACVYFVESGAISVMGVDPTTGRGIQAATVGSEGAVALVAGLGTTFSRNRSVVQVDARLLCIDAPVFQRLFEQSPDLQKVVHRFTEALLGQVIQSSACNALHSVQQRFCRWLLMCSDATASDELHMKQKTLAEMLGVQRTWVSSVASQLQDAGLLRYSRGQLRITDRAALERKACGCYESVRQLYAQALPMDMIAA